jgi:hypothetical protein
MSTSVAVRSHVGMPWTAVVITLLAVLAAAAILVLVDQHAEMTVETSPTLLAAPGAAVVPKPESRAEILRLTRRTPADPGRTTSPPWRRNLVIGASLDLVERYSPSRALP